MTSTTIDTSVISEVFSLLLIFTIFYVSQYYYRYFTRPNPIPGPFPLPILGNVHQQGRMEICDWMLSLQKKYGDMYEINMAGERIIVLCRHDLVENMVISSMKTKYPYRFKTVEGIKEYGFAEVGLTHNNDLVSWKYSRQFFSHSMMAPSFNYQSIEWTNELWSEIESYWDELGENYEIDLIKWMHRFTNEIIFKIATGVKNNAVTNYYKGIIHEKNISLNEEEKKNIEKSERFVESIETYIKGFFFFISFSKFIRDYVPFVRGITNNYLENKKYLFDKIFDIIKERRIEIENTPLDQPLHRDMLTSHIAANLQRDNSNIFRKMTDMEIFGNIIDAINGGTHTTANTFCFIVYHISKYPKVIQRLRQELDEMFGKDLKRPITFKNIENLHYCDAIIKETTRYCPIAYTVGRVSAEKGEVGGYIWPEGTVFTMFYLGMYGHKDYWTDPEKFDPDRFYKVEESDKYLLEKQHAKKFTMFGGGVRVCPGRRLAIIELKFLLAAVYRKYDLELVDKNAPLNYSSDLLTNCDELFIKIKPRKF